MLDENLSNRFCYLAFACMYVRYKQVQGYLEDISDANYKVVKISNKFAFYLSILICLGLSLVANFQVSFWFCFKFVHVV